MRIVFMGTPDFAVASLQAIVARGDEVVLVVSQQDRPRDRGKQLQMTPVKQFAVEQGLEVYQPVRIREDEAYERLSVLAPDLIVVTAYGQILPKRILELPRYGCINVHASLLPEYRGAAPIHYALMDGKKETGITTMYMSEGLDTGDMILQDRVEIDPSDNLRSLHDKLAALSKQTLTRTLDLIEKQSAPRTAQTDAHASYASLITKQMGALDFSRDAEQLCNLSRAIPVYTVYEGERVKLFGLSVGAPHDRQDYGTLHRIMPDHLEIVAGNRMLHATEIQFPNKKRMDIAAFLKGNNLKEGTIFGVAEC